MQADLQAVKDMIESNDGQETKIRMEAQKEINLCLQSKINRVEAEREQLIERLRDQDARLKKNSEERDELEKAYQE